jgi:AraC family transcriptional regulator of adaptative response / DNA-3-methyladenine glycosylase II
VTIDRRTCHRARSRRDPRYDGRFVVAVKTTGIYCRPVCPAPLARPSNVTFFATPRHAEREGFRPCRRCHPETRPGSPAWRGTGATVERALRLIAEGALDDRPVAELAGTLGIGDRHLRRLFIDRMGVPPVQAATARRVQIARRLIESTDLRMTEIAQRAGFASLRRFNAAFREAVGCPPSACRRQRRPKGAQT